MQFNPYRDNPVAPTATVSGIGGVYVDGGLVRVTLVDWRPAASGDLEAVVSAYLIWTSQQRWLDAQMDFKLVQTQFHKETRSRAAH